MISIGKINAQKYTLLLYVRFSITNKDLEFLSIAVVTVIRLHLDPIGQ